MVITLNQPYRLVTVIQIIIIIIRWNSKRAFAQLEKINSPKIKSLAKPIKSNKLDQPIKSNRKVRTKR
jgi:hypothetical protein